MTGYEQYISDVKSGKQIACRFIKQAVDRFEEFRNREDIYFDSKCVDECIEFISQLKHFLGKTAGKPFILEPWQEFIIANLMGLKWKSNGYRICRETYIQIARKAGKDAFMAALALYMLIVDGEASPEIACLANSREQARILFDYITNFGKSIDPKSSFLKYYRNYVKVDANNGTIKVYSADASKLDGLNISFAIIDEYHEAKDRKLYDVMKSSMGMRVSPLTAVISTAGFNLESPCHDMYCLGVEILNKIKTDDTFFPFMFCLDEDDDWTDPKNFIKVQPNLDVTVTREFMEGEVLKAKNDATAEVGVKTKTFNMWCSSSMSWIPQEIVVKCMGQSVDLNDYAGRIAVIGQDLGAVSDFSSISVCIPIEDNKYVFKTFCFLPKETLETSPNKELYNKFIKEGTMEITPGNCTDYDYIINKIVEISHILHIDAIYTDTWNATSEMVKLGELGFNVQPFSQGIGNFSGPTKELERLIRDKNVIIDKSSNILWQFGNVVLKMDWNSNIKPTKDRVGQKIDSVISMITALGGLQKSPVVSDTDIIFF